MERGDRRNKVEIFAGILNGYGISFLWICQTKGQIDKLYGQNAPILDHCRFIVIYNMSEHNAAEYFSNRAGEEGIIKQNMSSSGSRFDYGMNNMSISSDITTRRLITANEIENLPPEYELIFTQGAPTVLAKKVAYYSDPRFMDKVNLKKPETRAEMLKETYLSRVKRPGDSRWNDVEVDLDYENYDDNFDLNEIIKNKDVTEGRESEDFNDISEGEKEVINT